MGFTNLPPHSDSSFSSKLTALPFVWWCVGNLIVIGVPVENGRSSRFVLRGVESLNDPGIDHVTMELIT